MRAIRRHYLIRKSQTQPAVFIQVHKICGQAHTAVLGKRCSVCFATGQQTEARPFTLWFRKIARLRGVNFETKLGDRVHRSGTSRVSFDRSMTWLRYCHIESQTRCAHVVKVKCNRCCRRKVHCKTKCLKKAGLFGENLFQTSKQW